MRDSRGQNLLFEAARLGKKDIVKVLPACSSPNDELDQNWRCSDAVVQGLLEAGAETLTADSRGHRVFLLQCPLFCSSCLIGGLLWVWQGNAEQEASSCSSCSTLRVTCNTTRLQAEIWFVNSKHSADSHLFSFLEANNLRSSLISWPSRHLPGWLDIVSLFSINFFDCTRPASLSAVLSIMVRAPDPDAENGLEVTGSAIESVRLLAIMIV